MMLQAVCYRSRKLIKLIAFCSVCIGSFRYSFRLSIRAFIEIPFRWFASLLMRSARMNLLDVLTAQDLPSHRNFYVPCSPQNCC